MWPAASPSCLDFSAVMDCRPEKPFSLKLSEVAFCKGIIVLQKWKETRPSGDEGGNFFILKDDDFT